MKRSDEVQLSLGGGGRESFDWIQNEIVNRFFSSESEELGDSAILNTIDGKSCFSTDSFVVSPLEFPGGNIGDLCVHGTVNDLAVCGAIPRFLSLSLILEEGLSRETLGRVLDSIQRAVMDCDVKVVTGDTKVVPKGKGDGIFINTAGIGHLWHEFDLGVARIRKGDKILVNGTLGDHGMAVMAAREDFNLSNPPRSDTGPVHRLVQSVRDYAMGIRFMRDPTRGGVSTVLNEIFHNSSLGALLFQEQIPFSPAAVGVSEILGIDLLQVAAEGRLVCICDPGAVKGILSTWRSFKEGEGACVIGEVTDLSSRVVLESEIGGRRILDFPLGEILPRIC